MTAAVRSHDADTPPRPRAPADIMRAQSLAAMQPCRISAARALMIRAVRERWKITRLSFDIDAKAKGNAFYRIETPGRVFDFPVYSFEFSPKGRTGRIIGRLQPGQGELEQAFFELVHADDRARAEVAE